MIDVENLEITESTDKVDTRATCLIYLVEKNVLLPEQAILELDKMNVAGLFTADVYEATFDYLASLIEEPTTEPVS